MAKINYQNKVAVNPQPSIPNENKVTDADLNEIKASVNYLYDYPIDVGTSGITNGTDQCVLFQSGGKVEQSNLFKFDPVTGRFNINNVASPTAQINVKATNDMSGSAWLALRDSTDTFNRFVMFNNGAAISLAGTATALWEFLSSAGYNVAQIGVSNNVGTLRIGNNGSAAQFGANGSNDTRELSAGVFGKGKFGIGISPFAGTILPNENSTNILFFNTGVNPLMNWTTGYQQYSSNNGAFHYPAFRLSDGKVVKLEPIDSSTISSHTDLVNALISIGILY